LLLVSAAATAIGADLPPAFAAVRNNDTNALISLLDADSNAVLNARGPDNATPLHLAAALNNPETAGILITRGMAVNATTERGYTPLHWAATRDAGQAAALLLARGADTSATNTQGWTPLHVAAATNATGVTAVLCARKKDLLALTPEGFSPLHLAIASRATGAVETIILATPIAYDDPCLDVRTAPGLRAKRAGHLAVAYRMLSDLTLKEPGKPRANFALGLVCCSLADYARAQLAFDRVLAANPGNDRARLELANAYLAGGQPAPAKAEYRTVLARNPPPDVEKNIKAALKQAQKAMSKWEYSVRAEAGWQHDDNVNVGPDSRTIRIAPVLVGETAITELTIQEASRPIKSDGLYGSLGLSVTYDMGEKNAWLLAADLSLYQNSLSGADPYETFLEQAAFGFRYLGERTVLSLPAAATLVNYGHEPLVNVFGFNPVHRRAFGVSGDLELLTSATYEQRNYHTLADRDGYSISCGETATKYLGRRGHRLYAGIAASHDQTNSAVYRATTFSGTTGGELVLPYDIACFGRYRLAHSAYDEAEILAPERRKDWQNQFTVGIRRSSRLWGVEISYQLTDNDSTFDLYQYNRNVMTVSLSGTL